MTWGRTEAWRLRRKEVKDGWGLYQSETGKLPVCCRNKLVETAQKVFLRFEKSLKVLDCPCVVADKVRDYRYYLRMWAMEKEPKAETIKDLPRMNQVSSSPFHLLHLSRPHACL